MGTTSGLAAGHQPGGAGGDPGSLESSIERDKYLTFFLGDEEYGLEILKVQEIIGLLPITRVPRSAPHVRGVINLRGRVIPIIDLRLIFGLSALVATDETCIIVVELGGNLLGILVDRVSEVVDIGSAEKIGRAHVLTPVTWPSRMPSSA